MTRIGFTGTRTGMTTEQHRAFIAWFRVSGATELHHGCCLGADVDAWEVAVAASDLGFPRPKTFAHPPTNRAVISSSVEQLSDVVFPAKPYLERNRRIVDACDVLVACPKGPEELRSGTWFTVRHARRCGKRVVIIWPNGTATEEGTS